MATTDLKLDDPGSLPRPGPVGRLVRLAYGAGCAWYLVAIWEIWANLEAGYTLPFYIWPGLAFGLFLVNYVINIGFSRDWKKWPAIISVALFSILAGYGQFNAGTFVTEALVRAVWVWQVYVFSHLGTAYFISGLIGTPGCEMRAFHDLFSRITGIETKEHCCPVGPLHPIDQWEAKCRNRLAG